MKAFADDHDHYCLGVGQGGRGRPATSRPEGRLPQELITQIEDLTTQVSLFSNFNFSSTSQSCKVSNLLHGPESSNQILPREKRVNRDIFGTWFLVMNKCE